MSIKKAVSITVRGKVQGVGFRYFIKFNAKRLNLAGFVRNEPDSSVYIRVQGEERNINKLIELCRRGPMLSRVDRVEVAETEFRDYTDFIIQK